MKTQNRTVCLLVLSAIVFVTTSTTARADFVFGQPRDLGLGSGAMVNVSTDQLELYFVSDRGGGFGNEDLWVSVRQGVDEPWGLPANVRAINSSYREAFPSISSDGLTLYFSDYFYGPDRAGGRGGHDLWMSTRTTRNDPWGTPVNMGTPFNSSSQDVSPTISHDGLTFIFASDRGGASAGYDLWMCTRPSVQDAWGSPVNLGAAINSSSHDYYGNLSPDGLVLLFESNRSGGYAGWMTMRKTASDPWSPPELLPAPLYSMGVGCVSSDALRFYAGMSEVPLVPIVDFNGNGMVAIEDLVRLIESWGEHDPVVDIGPGPWGDGTVDAADLEMLMSYWEQEVDDPTLLAHWALDETEGDVAYDSASQNDAIVVGVPLWQPAGGQIGGALEFDGATLVIADTVVDPADGPFSVFAWIRGGGPGQVVLAQEGGANWLVADAPGGTLMTTLSKPAGRNPAPPLFSECVVTDGAWHRVGFVWDGTNRTLCVDGVVVAEDTQSSLAAYSGGLNIGCDKDTAFGSFFSGLIDDVRIYNRAIQPTAR